MCAGAVLQLSLIMGYGLSGDAPVCSNPLSPFSKKRVEGSRYCRYNTWVPKDGQFFASELGYLGVARGSSASGSCDLRYGLPSV